MRAVRPVAHDPLSGLVAVATYDAVRAVEVDPVRFSSAGGSRPGTGPMPFMIDMDDPSHKDRRRLVSSGFTPRRVRAHEVGVRDLCDALIDRVCQKGHCDLVADLAAPLPLIVIGELLGVAPSDRDDLLRWSDAMVASQTALAGEEASAVADAATGAFVEYHAYASAVIADRRNSPTGDLVSTLVHAEVDGEKLTDDEIVYETLLILVGGDETTRHVIAGGIEELCRHRDQVRRLAEDPSAVRAAVEEMLRWTSPVKTMARTVTGDTELCGTALRAGDELVLLYESANFDDAHFAEPDRFDSGRWPNDHLAFGLGTHHCLGASLARLEVATMTERILARLPDLTPRDDAPAPLRPNSFASGPMTVEVRFTPTEPVGATT